MHIAAIDWLSISINLLLVAFVIICLLMILLILMQRPKQEGLGAAFGGGVTDQVFGARTTNVLQRGTVYLGSLFFLVSLALAVLIGHQNRKTSLLDESEEKASEVGETAAAEPEPEEALPKSLSEELPVEEPATTGEEAPTGEQTSTADETSAAEETPGTEETPAGEETSTVDETPGAEETPAAEETPVEPESADEPTEDAGESTEENSGQP